MPTDSQQGFTAPLYGAQTRLALENAPATGRRMRDVPEFVRAYGLIKAAAARANSHLGALDGERARAIAEASLEVAGGDHNEDLLLPIVQGGGGTATNMNVNEVIATRSGQTAAAHGYGVKIHPNDHVNRSQSTNDTYPTAMGLAIQEVSEGACRSLDELRRAFLDRAERFRGLTRLGRTCLQDAVPLTAGDTHAAQAAAVERCRLSIQEAADKLKAVPIGGTAIGTGLGAPRGFRERVLMELRNLVGQELVSVDDTFDSFTHLDPYLEVANACRRAAVILQQESAGFRFLSSGPRGGVGELVLPQTQAGSTIMPGKVNPVIPELVIQLSFRARGAASAVEMGVAAGEPDLNIMEPVVLDGLLTAISDVAEGSSFLARRCVSGMAWDREAVDRNLRGSLAGDVRDAVEHGYDSITGMTKQGFSDASP